MLRLAGRMFPDDDFSAHRPTTHLPVISGSIGRVSGLSGFHTALVLVYTTVSGSATAGQRLLALDPHSPMDLRANIVRNLVEFHEAFDVAPGDGLWLEPSERVRIW